jgi:hypothetical protein
MPWTNPLKPRRSVGVQLGVDQPGAPGAGAAETPTRLRARGHGALVAVVETVADMAVLARAGVSAGVRPPRAREWITRLLDVGVWAGTYRVDNPEIAECGAGGRYAPLGDRGMATVAGD